MFMGDGFLVDTQQSGPRGGDKLYSANWSWPARTPRRQETAPSRSIYVEPGAGHRHRSPLSVAVSNRRDGVRQTASSTDSIRTISSWVSGFHYIRELGAHTRLELYVAPVGDPALGRWRIPIAHLPRNCREAPISHHWQDSTHISDDVVTVGLALQKIETRSQRLPWRRARRESLDHPTGRHRFLVHAIVVLPLKNWAAQVSVGRLTHPEALEPGDQVRSTASLEYTKPMPGGSWASSLIWGRNHDTATGRNLNSYLAESVLPNRERIL